MQWYPKILAVGLWRDVWYAADSGTGYRGVAEVVAVNLSKQRHRLLPRPDTEFLEGLQ